MWVGPDGPDVYLLLPPPALAGCTYTLIILNLKHYELNGTIVRALDVFVIVVPPALPAALTVGTVYALQRLKKQQIYCISPQRWVWSSEVGVVIRDGCGHQRWVWSSEMGTSTCPPLYLCTCMSAGSTSVARSSWCVLTKLVPSLKIVWTWLV